MFVKLSERAVSVTRTSEAMARISVGLHEPDHDLVRGRLAVGRLARHAQPAGADVARERGPRLLLVADRPQVGRQDDRRAREVAALAEAERVEQRGHDLAVAGAADLRLE